MHTASHVRLAHRAMASALTDAPLTQTMSVTTETRQTKCWHSMMNQCSRNNLGVVSLPHHRGRQCMLPDISQNETLAWPMTCDLCFVQSRYCCLGLQLMLEVVQTWTHSSQSGGARLLAGMHCAPTRLRHRRMQVGWKRREQITITLLCDTFCSTFSCHVRHSRDMA